MLAIFWVKFFLYVKSGSVHSCTETFSIFQEILCTESDSGALMQFGRRPMALPYPYRRRLEGAGHWPSVSVPAARSCESKIHLTKSNRRNDSIRALDLLVIQPWFILRHHCIKQDIRDAGA
jgi:hypothetical protein